MQPVKSARRWFWWHKWTSLICTVFLLLLCITGLPLVFQEEIEEWTSQAKEISDVPEGTPEASLDTLLQKAAAVYPGRVIRYAFWDRKEHPHQITMDAAPAMNAPVDSSRYIVLDNRTGEVLDRPNPNQGFMYVMLELHTEMFAGPGGKLFLGLMGILFVVAIISGFMLYGPIMKKYDFGMIRQQRSRRLRWLDMHNLLGIVTMTWMLVVGFTGVINTLSDVIRAMWQRGQLAEMVAPYKNEPPLSGTLSSVDAAVKKVQDAAPHMEPSLVAFPGTIFSSNHHYAIFLKGTTPVTSRLLMPALIDAKTGALTDMRKMPWYVNTLFLSEPLHFGDYGGLPLKILWALLDLATIVVLISGLYLWFARMKATRHQLARFESAADTMDIPSPALSTAGETV
ncbi:PepSY-associated TM helix domain-containing protein [Compostibacter hankyongensis]|uniref:PepSY domain-containing protein n=1 Tax=Compostibacter hankyongensis TaxID=1007089 RepID=A0ABP8FSA1_9BACT